MIMIENRGGLEMKLQDYEELKAVCDLIGFLRIVDKCRTSIQAKRDGSIILKIKEKENNG